MPLKWLEKKKHQEKDNTDAGYELLDGYPRFIASASSEPKVTVVTSDAMASRNDGGKLSFGVESLIAGPQFDLVFVGVDWEFKG